MKTQHLFCSLLVALAALPSLGCGNLHGDNEAGVRMPFALTPAEVRLARELAETPLDIPAQPHSPAERVYFIKMDLLPESQAETSQRQVIVIHYRYHGDETIFTTVDLNRLEVLKQEIVPHYPVGLAEEETARAVDLVRQDGRLEPLFAGPERIGMDARPLYFSDPAHPYFGHRLVHLLLRDRHGQRTAPLVVVDLTTEAVLLDGDAPLSVR